ncbi:MAG: DUF5060 domain-containing protein, partial [Planctomycetota bacterium]
MSSRTVSMLSAVCLALVTSSCRAEPQGGIGGGFKVKHTQNTRTIPAFEVFEITFEHDREYENPFFDVTIDVTLTSPSNKKVQVGGFHYGSSSPPRIDTHKTQTPKGERQ